MKSSTPYCTFQKVHEGIFVAQFSNMEPTENQFEEYLDGLLKLYHENHDFILVVDGSDVKYLESKFRTRMGKWMSENENLIIEKCRGNIYVVPNPLVKYFLQGIFLVKKPPVPFRIVSNYPEALEKAKSMLSFV